ncbi:MAG: histidine kinase, partial [Leptolyngbyaceae cyanobacterium SU_3_3]|nr:histidine kinase [Leptolyngbyaceae cyanobacterium SU_3_3]
TFIMERSGLLIASSSDRVLIDERAQRLTALKSDDRLIQATAQHLQQRFGNVAKVESSQQFNFQLDHQRQRVNIAPLPIAMG